MKPRAGPFTFSRERADPLGRHEVLGIGVRCIDNIRVQGVAEEDQVELEDGLGLLLGVEI